jgi:hypothetical protein
MSECRKLVFLSQTNTHALDQTTKRIPRTTYRPSPLHRSRLTLTADELRLLPGVLERLSSSTSSYSRPYDKDVALSVLGKMWVHDPSGKLSILLTRGMDIELGLLVTELLQCTTIPLARRAPCANFLRMVHGALTSGTTAVKPITAVPSSSLRPSVPTAPPAPAPPKTVRRSSTWFVNPFRRR